MTATTTYEWNTGRQYAADGQRIRAEVTPEGIHFYDLSRGIYGTVALPVYGKLDSAHAVRSHVMHKYDHNAYTGGEAAYSFFLRCCAA
jgi:hypothetical protein